MSGWPHPGWLDRRRQVARLEQADGEALIRELGGEAYWEAKRRAQDIVLPDGSTHMGRTPEHWWRVHARIGKITGQGRRVDTATRMAEDAGLAPRFSTAWIAAAGRLVRPWLSKFL